MEHSHHNVFNLNLQSKTNIKDNNSQKISQGHFEKVKVIWDMKGPNFNIFS
jgi:hypothetical protein